MGSQPAAKPVQMLRRSGRRLTWLREQERIELDRIAALVPVVLAEGRPKTEVARLARVSRPTVDAMLARQA